MMAVFMRHLSLVFAAVLLASLPRAQIHRERPTTAAMTSFAIAVDADTWKHAEDAIRRYRDAVERDGLPTWILAGDWPRPEAVRDALLALRDGPMPLEGAILVGRIPIAMIGGAQHLTTSFKMDERRFSPDRSYVPSDRFYDDFDLVFEAMPAPKPGDDGKGSAAPLLHYYRLAPSSPQRIEKDIYTARLLPTGSAKEQIEAIRTTLERFASRDRTRPRLDRVLTLMGHGYVSESLVAWRDAERDLVETLPALALPGGGLVSLHHERGRLLVATLRRELSDPALDLAILHSHGDDDREYLTGAPPLPSAITQIEALRRYLRGQLRRAKGRGRSVEERKRSLMARWDLPESWFEGAFDPEVTAADEALAATKEWTADEVRAIACGAEVIDLDACFNGAFTAPDYQAAAYLFGPGTVQAVVANSVNVGQDVWNDRNLYLLARGERVGTWHRGRPHLESHLFGDPTFRFARQHDDAAARAHRKIADLPVNDRTEARLLRELYTSPLATVRHEALARLAARRPSDLPEVLAHASHDPSSLVRRAAVDLMGDAGSANSVPVLLESVLRDPCDRVVYLACGALAKYDADTVAERLSAALAAAPGPGQDDRERILRRVTTPSFLADYRKEATDRTLPLKKRLAAVRTFRLYRLHAAIPLLIGLARATDEAPELRSGAIEALGWFVYAANADEIAAALGRIADDDSAAAMVRAAARKTLGRLAEGPNDPLMP